jgi:hypothetical protein
VLQHARLVAHGPDVLEVDLRQLGRPLRERRRLEDRTAPLRVLVACMLEGLDVAVRHHRPEHAATVVGRAVAEREPLRVVAQEIDDLAGDRLGVSPGDQDPAPVDEELPRVQVGRGDHGLAGANGVGQRPGRDLLRLEIRGDVDVRGGKELDELALAHETIVEDDVGVHAQALRAKLQHEPVGFPLAFLHVGMRGSEHDIDGVWMLRDDRG